MKRRAAGTGTVQEHQGVLKMRLPANLNPKRPWLQKQFPLDKEEEAHAYLDKAVIRARAIFDESQVPRLSLQVVWPRYMARKVNDLARKRGMHAGHKLRSHLEGVERNWLSESPFWTRDMTLIRGKEISDWLEEQRAVATNRDGLPVSDSWVLQLAKVIRGVFAHVDIEPPEFKTEAQLTRGNVRALNLRQQKQLFQRVLDEEADRIMAGCMMGAGLRKGELLSLRLMNVYVAEDPHVIIEHGGDHQGPTKSGKSRRVELFEPGLGFFRLAVRKHQSNRRGLLFAGPMGGYLKHWPDNFKKWADLMGMKLTSHMMRHTYAYSMLSGTWGYQPQDITFVSKQLGHTDIRTTQDSYGHWDPGAGLAVARFLRGESKLRERVVTANELLGEAPEYSLGHSRSLPRSDSFCADWVSDGKPSNLRVFLDELDDFSLDRALIAAESLLRASRGGRCQLEEARAFLVCLEFSPRVRHALELVLDGDVRGVAFAVALARDFLASSQAEATGEGASA